VADYVPRGSPQYIREEQRRRDREAQAYVQRHFVETGYLPKEYEIRRASDPDFNRSEEAEGRAALQEALTRLKLWEAHWRDVYQYNVLTSEQAISWQATWNRETILGSLGGTLGSVKTLPEEHRLTAAINEGRRKGRDVSGHEAALRNLQAAIMAHRQEAQRSIDEMIDSVINPLVMPSETAARIVRFLVRFNVIDVNLIKKLSELVSAKALWFSLVMPIALHPGPSALVDNQLAPDYVGHELVGDNFRVEGIKRAIPNEFVVIRGAKRAKTRLVLEPRTTNTKDARDTTNSINAIIKAVRGKYQKYKRTQGANRLVVTVDITDLPWALEQPYLDTILNGIDTIRTPDGPAAFEVYFIVGGRPRKVWPRT
jgi:hypothetical protein